MSAIVIIAAVFGSAGVAGAIVALFKVRPERESIIVHAAQAAVTVQSGLLDDIRAELTRQEERMQRMEVELRAEITALYARLGETTRDRDRLVVENGDLRRRIAALEAQVGKLENGSASG